MRRGLLIIFLFNHYSSFGQYYGIRLSIDSLKQTLSDLHTNQPFEEKEYLKTLNSLIDQYNYASSFETALTHSHKAVAMAERLNLPDLKATAYFNIAYALQKKELYFEAVKYFEESVKAALQAKNDSMLALAYHFTGMSYVDQKSYKRGIENYRSELQICLKAHLYFQTADCLNSIGLYFFYNQPDSALVYFSKCMDIALKHNIKFMQAISHKNVGRCYLRMGNEELGVKFIKKSIELCESEYQLVVYNYLELAKYYSGKKLYNESNKYALLGYHINLSSNFTDIQLEFCEILFKNHESIGNLSEAIKFLKVYQNYSNRINENLLKEQNLAIEERSKSQEQKAQILLLNQEKETKEKEFKWLLFGLLIISFFSASIFYLYQTIKTQKSEIENINQKLEVKVEERTVELQNAYDEIKEAMLNGQTIERKRVAAELHDNLGSLLSAIGLSMEIVNQDQLNPKEKSIFKHIQDQIDYAYKEVRLLSHNLQPEELEKYGLKKPLKNYRKKSLTIAEQTSHWT